MTDINYGKAMEEIDYCMEHYNLYMMLDARTIETIRSALQLAAAMEKVIDSIPLGHISMRRLTDGRIHLETHDGVGGGSGKKRSYNGDTAAAAIEAAIKAQDRSEK